MRAVAVLGFAMLSACSHDAQPITGAPHDSSSASPDDLSIDAPDDLSASTDLADNVILGDLDTLSDAAEDTVVDLDTKSPRVDAQMVLSDLPWLSGAATSDAADFVTWRQHPLGVEVSWDNRSSWAEIENPDIYGAISAFKSFTGVLELGTAMLPGDGATLASGVTFASCAAGDYDAYFVTLGKNLVKEGRDDSFIRLGWEANGNWYAWNAGNAASAAQWVACFQHEVTALRSSAPRVKIDWNMNADTKTPASLDATELYPGDAYVDVVGVDFYDDYPALDTDALWTSHYMDETSGHGPHGLGAWFAFATSHQKPLSVPEWGIVDKTGNCGCGGDDPVYVKHMHDFFAANAAHIAYEAYFNLPAYQGDTEFLVYPPTTSPKAAAVYESLF